jgi:hypothetical protein
MGKSNFLYLSRKLLPMKTADSRGQLILFIMLAVAAVIWLTSCAPQKVVEKQPKKERVPDTGPHEVYTIEI